MLGAKWLTKIVFRSVCVWLAGQRNVACLLDIFTANLTFELELLSGAEQSAVGSNRSEPLADEAKNCCAGPTHQPAVPQTE